MVCHNHIAGTMGGVLIEGDVLVSGQGRQNRGGGGGYYIVVIKYMYVLCTY